MPPNHVELYDATDRDGDQTFGLGLSAHQKIKIARRSSGFGIPVTEVGFAISSDIDRAVLHALREEPLEFGKHAAFGMTRRKNTTADKDTGMQAMLASGAPVLTVVGKSSPIHVREALKTTFEENRRMISDSVQFLGSDGARVIFDAEHFFDAYFEEGMEGREHALQALRAASEAGAGTLVLCDTNGGQTPERIAEATAAVCSEFHDRMIGIHPHNDMGLATANMRAAVLAGAGQVQGTWNRTGERTGNLDLVEVLGNLYMMDNRDRQAGGEGYTTDASGNLNQLTKTAHDIAVIMRQPRMVNQPFVGERAFAHKGGMHVSSFKNYEFADPDTFGNRRIIVGSKQSGRANVREIVKEMVMIDEELRAQILADGTMQQKVVDEIKRLETEGYRFDRAPASLELLVLRALGVFEPKIRELKPPVVFDVLGGDTEATIKVQVNGDGDVFHDVCDGDGPLDALSNALRKALRKKFDSMRDFKLTDYKVEIAPVSSEGGTGSVVDVYAEFTDGETTWNTTAASVDSIEAGWKAVVDAVEYKLLKDERTRESTHNETTAETP